MSDEEDAIRRLMDGWDERLDTLEWGIIADAYRDLGDDKQEAIWRQRKLWWGNLMLALSWTLGSKIGNGVATPLVPFYVNFRLCARSVYVDVNDHWGNIIPCPERFRYKRYWKWGKGGSNALLKKCLELILALEKYPMPLPFCGPQQRSPSPQATKENRSE